MKQLRDLADIVNKIDRVPTEPAQLTRKSRIPKATAKLVPISATTRFDKMKTPQFHDCKQ